jgi:hypothetical protein
MGAGPEAGRCDESGRRASWTARAPSAFCPELAPCSYTESCTGIPAASIARWNSSIHLARQRRELGRLGLVRLPREAVQVHTP